MDFEPRPCTENRYPDGSFQSLKGILVDFELTYLLDSHPKRVLVSIPKRDFGGFRASHAQTVLTALGYGFQSLKGILVDFEPASWQLMPRRKNHQFQSLKGILVDFEVITLAHKLVERWVLGFNP